MAEIEITKELLVVADTLEPKLRSAFLKAAQELQKSAAVQKFVKAIQQGNLKAALDALGSAKFAVKFAPAAQVFKDIFKQTTEKAMNRLLRVSRANKVEALWEASGPHSVLKKTSAGIRFDIKNPLTETAAVKHGAQLVTQVSAETRKAIADLTRRAFAEGIPADQIGRMIRPLIGLTSRQTQAVMNARAGWEAAGLTGDALEQRASKYANKLLRQRAEMIARTESIRAANAGQLEAWDEAVTEGLLQPERTKRVWSSAGEGKSLSGIGTCDICMNLTGKEAPLDKPFESSDIGLIMHPPAHPNCRCSTNLKFNDDIEEQEEKEQKEAKRPFDENDPSTWNSAIISERIEEIDEYMEELNDLSMFEGTFEESSNDAASRKYSAFDAIKTVLANQQRANENPSLAATAKFLYRFDDSVPGGLSAAAQATVKNGRFELEWIGNIKPGQGRQMIDELIEWGKVQGVTEMHGTAKYGSFNYYVKNFGAVADGRYDPISGNQPFVVKLFKPVKPKPAAVKKFDTALLDKAAAEHGDEAPWSLFFREFDENLEAQAMYESLDEEVIKKFSASSLTSPQNLIATQEDVEPKTVLKYLSKKETEEVVVLKLGGKMYIIDGHHRVAAAIIRKDASIKVKIIDGDRINRGG